MDSGDIAWILISAALVLFMVPGLSMFYGGMVRSKSMLNMLNMNMWCLGITPILWVLIGFSLAESETSTFWFIGNFDFAGLKGINDFAGLKGVDDAGGLALFAFFTMFAAFTPALISGAVADRMKFSAWMVFVPVWSLLVYAPVIFWVFGKNGWIKNLPALDFAGGTAIHVNAGAAALALALVVGHRSDWPKNRNVPHNIPLTILGAGILWFGWFGFNAGSALLSDALAVQAFVNTFLAGASGMVAWAIVELMRTKRVSAIGISSGIVAALVAITPAAGFVGPMHSLVFGLAAGVVCYFAIEAKYYLKIDDSLNVVGIHLVGGVVGGMLVGLLADASAVPGGDFIEGVLFGGGAVILWNQFLSILAVAVYSFVVTYIIAKVLDRVMGLRVSRQVEMSGIDVSSHGGVAYTIEQYEDEQPSVDSP